MRTQPTGADAGLEWFAKPDAANADGEVTTPEAPLHKTLALGDADRRLERLRSRETLGLRVNPANYKIHWSVVESEEWWLAAPETPRAAAEVSRGAVEVKDRAPVEAKAAPAAKDEVDAPMAGVAEETATATEPTNSGALDALADAAGADAASTAAAAAAEASATNTTAEPAATTTEAEAEPASSSDAPTTAGPATTEKPTSTPTPAAPATETFKTQTHADHNEDGDAADAAFEEKFVMNNRWMAGLSRDAVDGRNREYRVWRERLGA